MALSAPKVALVGHMAIWLDEAGTATWQQAHLQPFEPVAGNVTLGHRPGVVWVRMLVQRDAGSASDWLLEVSPAHLDLVTLWVEPASTSAGVAALPEPVAQRAGLAVLPQDRPRWHRKSVFPVNLPDTQAYTLWLRVDTETAKTVIPVMWRPESIEESNHRGNWLMGLLYGVLVFITAAAMILGSIAGNRLFQWCGAYFFSIGAMLFTADGWFSLLLLPAAPRVSHYLTSFCLALAIPLCSTVFFGVVRGERHAPRLVRAYLRVAWSYSLVAVLLVLAGGFAKVNPWLNYVAIAQLVVVIAVGLWIWPREPQTRWVILSFLPIILPGLLRLVRNVGYAPSINWLDVGTLAGLTCHALILFFIVAHKVGQVYRASLEAKSQALLSAAQLDEQRHFVALLSHEIRNPLATLDGAISNLMRDSLGPASDARLDRMSRAVERLQYVLGYCLADERLSTLALSERPQIPLTPALIVQESLKQLADESGRLQLTPFDAAGAAGLDRAQVLGDLVLLGVALKNLLDNALKYDPLGQVHLSVAVDKGRLTFAVRDHGPGLDAQASSRLFEKFARGQQHPHLSGAGLGLHLSRRIAQQHGGDIHVRNASGGGVVAGMALPLARSV